MIWLIAALLFTVPSVNSLGQINWSLNEFNPSYTFSSPNYPNPHNAEEDCSWLVSAPANVVELKLSCNIDIISSRLCSSAAFTLYPYPEDDVFCKKIIITKTIKGNTILCKFKSSMSENPKKKGVSCTVSYNPKDIPTGTTSVESSCTCGDKGGKRIVGGKETESNEYPWQALLMLRPAMNQHCGGALIAKQWVLSACHCIPDDPSSIIVVLGEHHIENCDSERQYFEVIDAIKHENFDKKTRGDNDIALIKLAEPVADNPFISPICLPFNYKNYDFTDKVGIIAGWGAITQTEEHIKSNVPIEIEQKIIMPSRCTWLHGYVWRRMQITENMICGLSQNGGFSRGDTGGSMFWRSELSKRYFLVGVASRFIRNINGNEPSLYTRVSQFIDWIEEKTRARREFCVKI